MRAPLYLHIPYCAGACDYCDFYSLADRSLLGTMDRFVDRLLDDCAAELSAAAVDSVPTIFIGGGTPSLLGAARLGRLLAGLKSLLPERPGEFTIEANPESLDEDLLRACREGGVTRISLGLQSLSDASRRAVGRIGSAAGARAALALAAQAYPGALSVDLMSGLPFQTEGGLLADIDEVLRAGASHVSLYALTLEDHTPLAERALRGDARLPSGDEADALWIAGRDALIASGCEHYEVSNFAREGARCLHNCAYWRMEGWLGCGPAASGTIVSGGGGTALRGVRRTVAPDLAAYLSSPPVRDEELLDERTLAAETVMMAFRTSDGLDCDLFRRRFGASPEDRIGGTLEAWRGRSLLRPDRTALTEEGLLLLDHFLVDCLRELEAAC